MAQARPWKGNLSRGGWIEIAGKRGTNPHRRLALREEWGTGCTAMAREKIGLIGKRLEIVRRKRDKPSQAWP